MAACTQHSEPPLPVNSGVSNDPEMTPVHGFYEHGIHLIPTRCWIAPLTPRATYSYYRLTNCQSCRPGDRAPLHYLRGREAGRTTCLLSCQKRHAELGSPR